MDDETEPPVFHERVGAALTQYLDSCRALGAAKSRCASLSEQLEVAELKLPSLQAQCEADLREAMLELGVQISRIEVPVQDPDRWLHDLDREIQRRASSSLMATGIACNERTRGGG